MDVKVTERGIYMQDGSEVEVGTILTLSGPGIPVSFVNKCIVIGEEPTGAELTVSAPETTGTTTVTLPPVPVAELVAVHRGRGSWSVMNGENELLEGLTTDHAKAFNEMSADDKQTVVDMSAEDRVELFASIAGE